MNIVQIYFDEKSQQHLDNECIEYNKNWEDDFFENSVIEKVYHLLKQLGPHNKENTYKFNSDYIGVTSWKIGSERDNKSHITAKEIKQFIQQDIDSKTEKDVYIYSPIQGLEIEKDHSESPPKLHGTINWENIFESDWHKYSEVASANKLLNDSGVLPFNIFDGKWQYCHCNYWIAREHIFYAYCEKVLFPALEFFKRPEIQGIMPKWYKHSHNGKLYNSCCFTFEGLFGSFLAHTNYNFDYICKKRYKGKYHMVKIDGYKIK